VGHNCCVNDCFILQAFESAKLYVKLLTATTTMDSKKKLTLPITHTDYLTHSNASDGSPDASTFLFQGLLKQHVRLQVPIIHFLTRC
jgi:hypothetical protein